MTDEQEEAARAAEFARIDEQRSALLRSVSHDLRTPLATIRAIVSDLLSGTDHDIATTHELLGLVASETERLDRLVANLLNLSRIEADAFEPDRQAIPIDELVQDTVRRLARVLEHHRVSIDLPEDLPLVDGDYVQLQQVVSNLLENAARHGPIGSTIRCAGRRIHDHVELWIDDEGRGLARFERTRIFEPFRRGEGSASSGIGLAICKAVVEAHGGTIVAEESPFGGARFRFTLPVRS